MKKTLTYCKRGYPFCFLKVLLIIKLTIFLLIFNLSQIYATVFSRNNQFDLNLENNLIIILPQVLQNRMVTGKVTDASTGEPVPGVNIVVEGTTIGTITAINGDYRLEVPGPEAVLVYSFVGYITQKIAVADQQVIDVSLAVDFKQLDEVVMIGYGTRKKSDLTGAVMSLKGTDFKNQSMAQITDMLTGTVAGFYGRQSTSAAGGSSLEIRGPTSLTAGTSPLIVIDGVIFKGSLRDINPNDIESIDILKDASSSAVFGSKAAAGIVILTTTKGKAGKPTINFSTKLGIAESNNERRGLGPEEYIQFRQDYFRQLFPNVDYNFYTNPNQLPPGLTIEQWRALSATTPQEDNLLEWMARLRLFPEEQKNYLAGKTMDMYDEVFRRGVRQEYDLSIAGGTENSSYFWSVGYNNNEGIRVGDQYSSIRSRLNLDYKIVDWLNVGLNTQFSDRDESSVPASLSFYVNSPYGEMFDEEGNLKRYPHGHSDNPLLSYYRNSVLNKTSNFFTNIYADLNLPFGFKYRLSFQPRYQTYKYLTFTTISKKLGGTAAETPTGERRESTRMDWMVDNILTWNKIFGIHNIDLTFLANFEENRYWSTTMTNRNFSPSQQLGYHGLHFGDTPGINNNDERSTGDALMARMNYILMGKYFLTASVRRDGYSAFGGEYPRAVFPAFAAAWTISEESFFNVDIINWLKLRLSWGSNGNRDIGIYSSLARTGSNLWYDGTSIRVGVYNSTLANSSLRWERTTATNLGLDLGLLENRISLTADVYDTKTTDLLMTRILPRVTGFSSIMANLGELSNRGVELTLNTVNISQSNFSWRSNLVFSLNRNKILKLFGDIGVYTLLGEERTGEVPDYSNHWFPGQAVDVVWDYEVTGIWQTGEADQAKVYNMEPGDFKAVDVNDDGRYVDLIDKQFIGHTAPRYLLGFRNDLRFLKNFTASFLIRADLGHIAMYNVALNSGQESNDRWNRNNGPVPYWTVDRPHNEYARLNPYLGAYGGGIRIFKPSSFVRVQDISLTYDLPAAVAPQIYLSNLQIFGSIRNLATFTKWPGWDPESGMNPMPRTYTLGLRFSL